MLHRCRSLHRAAPRVANPSSTLMRFPVYRNHGEMPCPKCLNSKCFSIKARQVRATTLYRRIPVRPGPPAALPSRTLPLLEAGTHPVDTPLLLKTKHPSTEVTISTDPISTLHQAPRSFATRPAQFPSTIGTNPPTDLSFKMWQAGPGGCGRRTSTWPFTPCPLSKHAQLPALRRHPSPRLPALLSLAPRRPSRRQLPKYPSISPRTFPTLHCKQHPPPLLPRPNH